MRQHVDAPGRHTLDAKRQLTRLTRELTVTRAYLQSLLEQQQAGNEQLQTIYEELQASKEQLHSRDEKLTSVNEELSHRDELLAQVNSDLANFLASTHVALVVLDRDLRLRRFTSDAEKLLNLVPADVGRSVTDLRLPLVVADLEKRLGQVIESVDAEELEVQDKNGRWYSLRLRPYKTLDHQIDGVVMVLIDIDAQKRSEQSLASALAAMSRLQEVGNRLVQASNLDAFLYEIVDTAIAITAADMGNIQLRDRGSAILRIVANRGFDKAFLDFFADVHDNDSAACGTAMHRGERVVIEDVTKSEIFAGTPALDVLLAAGVRGVQSTPLVGRSGALVGVLSTHYRIPKRPANRDLALLDLLARQAADGIERIQIEEARLEAANRSQQLLNVTSAGVYAVDTKGVMTYYNRQAVEFWGRSPVPGDTHEQFWPPARRTSTSDPSRPPDVTPIKNALSQGTSVRGLEGVIERPDGLHLPVQMNVDPIRDADGRIVGAITVFYDVTHLKRALTADRLKDQFVAMLAHELRNPLAALSLTVALMHRDRDAGIAAGDLGVMDRQVKHLARLVDDLLDVTRMRLGKIKLLKAPIDLRTVVKSAVESVLPDVEAKNRTLSVDLPPESLYVEGDAARLGEALTNLLDNAIKYTDAGGRIGVTLAADHEQAVLRVTDTGIGIKPDMLPHIFDLFAQEEDLLSRSRGGLGIGLFMVARLAEMHAGSVEAHSAGLGMGAEFTIRLPRLSRAQEDRLAAAQTGKVSSRPSALRVLVVEDNVDVADWLTTLLRYDGHEVRLERDGPAAVAAAGAFRPTAVLLDIGLPGMDGYQVARRIREQSGLENVGIVGLSGYTHEDARRRAMDAGFNEFLAKPVDLQVLEATLGRLVHPER